MPIVMILLGMAVFAYMWISRRGSTLTRACRWRLDRSVAPDFWHCAACGATLRGAEPRDCLRQQ